MTQHNGDWAYGPLMKACSVCSITIRVSAATFPEKSQAAHSSAFNKTFNATDSLFISPVCEVACCFFWSLLALWVNCYYKRTNKEKIDDYRRWNLKLETETEVRSKNTPAITDYHHRCRERQRSSNSVLHFHKAGGLMEDRYPDF